MNTASSNTHTMKNGRKTLASQIDRLDDMLDGLADGLNDAVSSIVKEAVQIAVKEAVQAVLTEVLTNPEVLQRLGVSGQSSLPKTTLGEKIAGIKQGVAQSCKTAGKACRLQAYRLRLWCGRLLQQGKVGVSKLWRQRKHLVGQLWKQVRSLPQRKGPLLAALGIGLVAGGLGFICGPWLNAVLSATGSFMAVQAKFFATHPPKEIGMAH